ncbi:hypothetical protein BKA70DRAFT_741772 [Coprinopsis sp. MPI-PUGE-AT-0042]|nr:hypothetical protein BKA70DRAFT_741772 [Coprinopsis sp. MPI-PUGE-AT-0042]
MWPVAPLAVPHAASEDDVYNDYFIPVVLSLCRIAGPSSAILQSIPTPTSSARKVPKGRQDQSRYLDPNACAFGFGRRICPADGLAKRVFPSTLPPPGTVYRLTGQGCGWDLSH